MQEDHLEEANPPVRVRMNRHTLSKSILAWIGGSAAALLLLGSSVRASRLRPNAGPREGGVDAKEPQRVVNLTNGDSVAKFDPKTEKWTEYPLPTRGIALLHISLSERNGTTEVVVGDTRNSKVASVEFRTKEELQALTAQVREKKLSASAHEQQ
jgi:hypothetical protein